MKTANDLKVQEQSNNLDFIDCQPKLEDFRQEAIQGLRKNPKQISPKFLYDERGSKLFNQICNLEEYYLTRTEMDILQNHAEEMALQIGEGCCLVEFGSGNNRKVRTLLEKLKNPLAYMPIDISKEYLLQSAEEMANDYPDLDIVAICADYTQEFPLPEIAEKSKKVAFFPGSTIGNFKPEEASKFLENTNHLLQKGGGLLIGVDLKKSAEFLDAAYNDSRGVTSNFNKNLLLRMNEELDAQFDLKSFKHEAFYVAEKSRVEMHLVSEKEQTILIGNFSISFSKGESIHTENSYKYTLPEFQEMTAKAGFETKEVWTDQKDLFSVHYLAVG